MLHQWLLLFHLVAVAAIKLLQHRPPIVVAMQHQFLTVDAMQHLPQQQIVVAMQLQFLIADAAMAATVAKLFVQFQLVDEAFLHAFVELLDVATVAATSLQKSQPFVSI